ncbi:glycosyltransferase family 4 protein [Nocardioides donggukensis]|uniref:Glycosyltransferase family 4 protein n=1 Tax=Nocardioides donggukensis TaxID=2774019 RepID=A0A927K462_9ACTN|nr:glycosyltransferase family 4 protein [Nocardioides donggukensis]MBD8869496.1 glycosyltransferase family 4 protein [Nocardioides donggukensis]
MSVGGSQDRLDPPVLHVSQPVEAGVAQVVVDLVRVQAEAGRRVVVACPPGHLQDLAAAVGAEVLTWSAGRGPGVGTLTELSALSRVIRRVRPGVVHLHSSQAGMVGRLLIRGRLPTVFSPHAWSWQPMTGAGRRAAIAWERRAARWAHAIVCVSDGERRDGLEQRVPGSLLVIPNGVEADLEAQIGHDTEAVARRALGRGRGTHLVVCCARLAEQKGQDDLLSAWRLVSEACPGAELVLVGDGPMRSELEVSAADLAGVTFAGWQSRVECLRWMRAATVVVCPSRYEAMSLVPLEAAALGTPVVATRVEGMATTMSADARRMVGPGDPGALAGALLDLLRDRDALDRGGREAAAWSREQAATSTAGSEYLAVYDRVRRGHSG